MAGLTREGYQEYLKSEHWGRVRDEALEAAEYRCQLCYSPDGLEVHHRTYARLGREYPMDLTVLCAHCHEAVHDLIEHRKRLEFGEEQPPSPAPRKRWELAPNYVAMQPTSQPPAPVPDQGRFLRLARGEAPDPKAE